MSSKDEHRPLAAALRPSRLEDYIGQQHLLGAGRPLQHLLSQGTLHSMVLWGPPGCGKTTLARLLTEHCDHEFVSLSAVLAGVKDIRHAIAQAEERLRYGRRTVLFVDEAHRFNKAQQDAFLPHVEEGTIVFVGATTENPSFELNAALLSRARVYLLEPLSAEDLAQVITRGLRYLPGVSCEDAARDDLIALADGDARRALTLLEIGAQLVAQDGCLTAELVRQAAGERARRFDKGGDAFYDQISALHKSVRGSDPDAALYWFARMLDGGAPPEYIARRLLRMAIEDVGNADPRALSLSLDAWQTYERLGSPEGELALAQVVLYLASVPKSNAAYVAFGAASEAVRAAGSHPVPEHLRNAPTRLAKSLGHGDGYRYAHDEAEGYAAGETTGRTKLLRSAFITRWSGDWRRRFEQGWNACARVICTPARLSGKTPMTSLWLVMAGGALGAAGRYGLGLALGSAFTQPGVIAASASWPWATWLANTLGCLAIGALWGLAQHAQWFADWGRTFVLVGVLGGFTTYSSFALETLRLLDSGRAAAALVYAIGTLAACLLLVWCGRSLGQWVQSSSL